MNLQTSYVKGNIVDSNAEVLVSLVSYDMNKNYDDFIQIVNKYAIVGIKYAHHLSEQKFMSDILPIDVGDKHVVLLFVQKEKRPNYENLFLNLERLVEWTMETEVYHLAFSVQEKNAEWSIFKSMIEATFVSGDYHLEFVVHDPTISTNVVMNTTSFLVRDNP
jgi:hypothetical protein